DLRFVLRAPFLRLGTFFPFLRASDRPMAIACLRLLTVPPRPPLPRFSLPFFFRRIAFSTSLPALREYFLAMTSSAFPVQRKQQRFASDLVARWEPQRQSAQ